MNEVFSFNSPTGEPQYWLYMLSNAKPSGPLYLGDTEDLIQRMEEHRNGVRRDYAHYHRLDRLVYFEVWDDAEKFAARLRRVRNWPRDMRLLLIESLNPDWLDLSSKVFEITKSNSTQSACPTPQQQSKEVLM